MNASYSGNILESTGNSTYDRNCVLDIVSFLPGFNIFSNIIVHFSNTNRA